MGCGWSDIPAVTIAFTQPVNPRPAGLRRARETATAVGGPVNSALPPTRTNSLKSGSGSGGGGSALGCRMNFGNEEY